MTTPRITPSSSAEVIPFPTSGKPTFAKDSKAWLMMALEEPSIKGHAPRTFFTAIYLHFNYEHYKQSGGELIAWPSWETLMGKFGLSEGGFGRASKRESAAASSMYNAAGVTVEDAM